MILLIALQPKNAESPIIVTELGIVIDVKPLQFLNAALPIEVTELGIVIDVKPLQPENAKEPIFVTELLMVTDFKLLKPSNANLLISVIPPGILRFVISEPFSLRRLANNNGFEDAFPKSILH